VGLSPWDVAAGSLIITEAGGLIGNFTGEADFLYQREAVAGNPKIYGQLVQLLTPYTRIIKDEAAEPAPPPPAAPTAEGEAPKPRKSLRVKKAATPDA
jgi:myo-inositol-1(or 4)-monophosphatase